MIEIRHHREETYRVVFRFTEDRRRSAERCLRDLSAAHPDRDYRMSG